MSSELNHGAVDLSSGDRTVLICKTSVQSNLAACIERERTAVEHVEYFAILCDASYLV